MLKTEDGSILPRYVPDDYHWEYLKGKDWVDAEWDCEDGILKVSWNGVFGTTLPDRVDGKSFKKVK